MNIFRLSLLCLISTIFFDIQNANCWTNCDNNKNVEELTFYLNPNTIHICDEGIYLYHNENWISISSLKFDGTGLKGAYKPVNDDDWRCFRGHWNYKNSKYCIECGAECTNSSPRWRDHRPK